MILLFEPFILQNFRNFDPLQLSNILIRNLRTWQKWEMEKPKTHSKIYFIVKSYRQRIRIKNTFNQLLSTKWKTWRHYKASIMNLQPKNNPCQRFHFSVNKTCIKSNQSRNTHFCTNLWYSDHQKASTQPLAQREWHHRTIYQLMYHHKHYQGAPDDKWK